MALEDYLVPYSNGANICFDCKKACGGCPWSEVDPDTNKIRFDSVPGWDAELVTRRTNDGLSRVAYRPNWHIKYCPLFDPDEPRESSNSQVSDEQFSYILERWRRLGELG